jgi:hypothetical protein
MADEIETEISDTLKDEGGEAKSSSRVLTAIRKATDTFRDYQDTCRRIDDVYSRDNNYDSDWLDPEYDLFWASMEILKPAIYAHAPVPAVARCSLIAGRCTIPLRSFLSVFQCQPSIGLI